MKIACISWNVQESDAISQQCWLTGWCAYSSRSSAVDWTLRSNMLWIFNVFSIVSFSVCYVLSAAQFASCFRTNWRFLIQNLFCYIYSWHKRYPNIPQSCRLPETKLSLMSFQLDSHSDGCRPASSHEPVIYLGGLTTHLTSLPASRSNLVTTSRPLRLQEAARVVSEDRSVFSRNNNKIIQ